MPNEHVTGVICKSRMEGGNVIGDHLSTTELDSHANMAVLGKHSTIFNHTGLHAEVHGWSDDLPRFSFIVDA